MTGLRKHGLIEISNSVAPRDTSATPMECPSCTATVYAPADSYGEALTCHECKAELVTAQAEGGVVALLRGGLP